MAGNVWRFLSGGFLVVLLLAGCAGDRPVTQPTLRNPNAWSFAQGVMDRGPMLV